MPNILKELKLTELSLVDRPANPEAMAPIFKRDSKGEETLEDTFKMSDKMKERVKYYMEEKGMSRDEAVKACGSEMDKAWDLDTENQRLRKFLIENDYVIKSETIEKKEAVEQIDINGEMVNKADIPAPVLKALEAAELEKRDAALEKRATEELPHFDKEVAKNILKFDLDEATLAALKAADAAFEAAMGEAGESGGEGDMSDPATKLDKMVEAVVAEKGLNKQAAFAEVAKTKEGKALINKTYQKD